MARYLTGTAQCRCCGETYEVRYPVGAWMGRTPDLDTNPHEDFVYDRVFLCPHCGYATDDLNEACSEDMRSTMATAAYRGILQDPMFPKNGAKALLAAQLQAVQGNANKAGQLYLMAYWACRELDRLEPRLLEAAIAQFSQYLEEHMDIPCAVKLVDCLRQDSQWEEARDTAEYVLEYVQDAYLRQILRYELTLIEAMDDLPHAQSEVQA